MKSYYLTHEIEHKHGIYDYDKEDAENQADFQSKEALMADIDEFFGKNIAKSYQHLIQWIEVEPFDYYSIQVWADGFGNDGAVCACCKTLADAKKWVEENQSQYSSELIIVGQWWNKDFVNAFG